MGSRGPAKARAYSATEPLFARDTLRFSGRVVALREQVPEGYFSSQRQRRQMWDHRKVDHSIDLPVKLAAPPSQAAPVPPPATVQSPEVAVSVREPIDPNGAAVAAARYTARTYGAPVAFEKVVEAAGPVAVTPEPPPIAVNVIDQRPPGVPQRNKRR